MNCDKALEVLSAELDGMLGEAEHAELQAHLAQCADCRRVYETLRDVDAMLPETQLEPPRALHDAVMREVRADAAKRQQKKRWVPVAVIGAAAAAAFVLGSFGLIEMPGFSNRNQSSASLHEIVDTLFPETQSDEHTSEAAAQYARDNACAVLAIWDCASLPELADSNGRLSDGGWVYPVDAETLETLLEQYRDVYPMESYAPDGAVKTAAIVLYEQ